MKIEKNPFQCSSSFESYKCVKFHFRLGTILRKTEDWEWWGCGVNTGTGASLAISLFLSCFSCAEEEDCVDENMNGIVEYSE